MDKKSGGKKKKGKQKQKKDIPGPRATRRKKLKWAELPSPPGPLELGLFLFQKWSDTKGLPKRFISFVAVTLGALMVHQMAIAILPGPKIFFTYSTTRQWFQDGDSCLVHLLEARTDNPVEHLTAKLQFLGEIDDYAVDFPNEYWVNNKFRGMEVWAVSMDPNTKKCKIQPSHSKQSEVRTLRSGNIIRITAVRIPENGRIYGIVAVNTKNSAVRPAPKTINTEGSYQYEKLGQTVRKPLRFVATGYKELKAGVNHFRKVR